MPHIVEINGHINPSPSQLEAITEQFSQGLGEVYAHLDNDDALIVEQTELGFVVCTIDYVLADPTRPEEIVTVAIGGQDTPIHHQCLVPQAFAIPAVVHFLEHLDTPAELGWISTTDMPQPLPEPILDDKAILELWHQGNRIEAIREYRRSHKLGLAEALTTLQNLAAPEA